MGMASSKEKENDSPHISGSGAENKVEPDAEPLTENESCGTRSVTYSVILKPVSENAKKPNVSPGKRKENLNRDVLEEKQKAAETRRKSFEGDKLARLAMKDERIKQAQAKVQETVEQQSKTAEEKLKQKLESQKEKREAILKALQERLQASNEKIKEANIALQESIGTHSKATEEKLRAKLKVMEENRQCILLSIKEKLHAKSVQIEQARKELQTSMQAQKEILEEKIHNDMAEKEENRLAQLKQKQERCLAYDRHVEEVRQAKQQLRATEATG